MTRHLNHRGWYVLESIASDDGAFCVDFFEDADGRFGFEVFRADPEDRGRWTAIGGHGSTRFTTATESVEVAEARIVWLGTGRAVRSLRRWVDQMSA